MTENYRLLKVILSGMRSLNSRTITIGPRQVDILPMPPIHFLQNLTGKVHAHSLLAKFVERSKLLSYLGQLLHDAGPDELKQLAKRRVENMVLVIMSQ